MQLTLNIPEFALLTLNKDIQELKQTIKTSTALMLFKNGKFSIEQASHFAPIPLMDESELENEMKLMKGNNESNTFNIQL
jgi:hypothetical protein